VVQVTLVDASRPGPARGDTPESPARQLTVTIWYPTASGTFPLVVFAHGFDASASTYSALEHDLAAAGFVVAAPDFPVSSSAIPGPPAQTDIVEQAHDVSFVITSLLSGSGVPPVLSGHLAPTRVGVVGHSDGGTTVAEAAANSCCADARIGALVVLSGDEGHDGGQWFANGGPPVLVVQGTADDVNPPSLSQTLFDDASAPKLYVAITGGAHLSPYTDGPQRAAITTLLVDFLRAELVGDGTLTKVLADADIPGILTLAASAL
jgi:predicted dienelactone hydrolase